MRLILTRHGETIENAEGIIQGQSHGRLSELGKEQARKVANRLKEEKIDAIYSSDLERAAHTAEEIAKYHPHVRINFVRELRERHFGVLQGKKRSDADWNASKEEYAKPHTKPEGGESLNDIFERARKFLDSVLHKHRNDTVLFVAHGGLGRALIAVITGKPPSEFPNIGYLSNTSVSIFEIDETRNHKIHLLNSTEHLQ